MSINWIQICIDVLMVIFGFLCMYIKTKKDILDKAAGKISEAETVYESYTKAGNEKFEWVVDAIFSCVPPVMKPFITRTFIGETVQKVFDQIESYSVKQLDKFAQKIVKKNEPEVIEQKE